MPTKFPYLVLILVSVLPLLVEYEDLVEYTDTSDVGIDVVNAGMCQLVLSNGTLFYCWGVSLLGVHFRVFLCAPLERWCD